jgi:hypothetical protein
VVEDGGCGGGFGGPRSRTLGLVGTRGPASFSAEGPPRSDPPWVGYFATPDRPATLGAGVTFFAPGRHKPGVTAAIVGATRIGHLEDALAAAELTLSAEEIAQLESVCDPRDPWPSGGPGHPQLRGLAMHGCRHLADGGGLDPSAVDRTRRSNGCRREGGRMNPGLDPLDPLELALLLEVAEDLGDLDRDDPPTGEVGAEDGGQDDEEP